MKNYSKEDINRFNNLINNEEPKFEPKTEYEKVILSLVTKIRDLYGRGTVLSMTYQIGSDGGIKAANEILNQRGGKTFDDPIEAMVVLSTLVKHQYSIFIESIDTEESSNTITVNVLNRCAFREMTTKYKEIRPGSSICRIGKGFFESALKLLLKDTYKIEISFKENVEAEAKCREIVKFIKK